VTYEGIIAVSMKRLVMLNEAPLPHRRIKDESDEIFRYAQDDSGFHGQATQSIVILNEVKHLLVCPVNRSVL
jgi:hypothetical protein